MLLTFPIASWDLYNANKTYLRLPITKTEGDENKIDNGSIPARVIYYHRGIKKGCHGK